MPNSLTTANNTYLDNHEDMKAYLVVDNYTGKPVTVFSVKKDMPLEKVYELFNTKFLPNMLKAAKSLKAQGFKNNISEYDKMLGKLDFELKEVPYEYAIRYSNVLSQMAVKGKDIVVYGNTEELDPKQFDFSNEIEHHNDEEDELEFDTSDSRAIEYDKEVKEVVEAARIYKPMPIDSSNNVNYAKSKLDKLNIQIDNRFFNYVNSIKNKDDQNTTLIGWLLGEIESLKYENDTLKSMVKEKRGY